MTDFLGYTGSVRPARYNQIPGEDWYLYYTTFSADYYSLNYICDINNRLYVIIVT